MGLFDSGNKEQAEAEVLQALTKHPMLGNIMAILNGELLWPTQCTGYYDTRKRTVMVGRDLFCIKMQNQALKANEKGEVTLTDEEPEFVFLTYTQFGYNPLHMYTASNGKTVNLDRVISIWAKVLSDALKAEFPDGEFENIIMNEDVARFTYKVPALAMKDWF